MLNANGAVMLSEVWMGLLFKNRVARRGRYGFRSKWTCQAMVIHHKAPEALSQHRTEKEDHKVQKDPNDPFRRLCLTTADSWRFFLAPTLLLLCCGILNLQPGLSPPASGAPRRPLRDALSYGTACPGQENTR